MFVAAKCEGLDGQGCIAQECICCCYVALVGVVEVAGMEQLLVLLLERLYSHCGLVPCQARVGY